MKKMQVFYLTTTNNEVKIILPTSLKQTDYTAIVAEIKNEAGIGIAVCIHIYLPNKPLVFPGVSFG